MRRFKIGLFLWAGLLCRAETKEADARPNILMIISDDQGYGDFSCFGNPILKTPNLDRLKEQSVYVKTLITTPLCSPTRACVMTGRFCYRTGVWDTYLGRQSMASDEITLAEMLKAAGYRTALFGKWHLGDAHPFRPENQGFQEVWFDNNQRFDGTFCYSGPDGRRDVPIKGFQDDAIFDRAIDYVTRTNNQPFFMYVASKLPHDIEGPMVPEENRLKYLEAVRATPCLGDGDAEVYGMVDRLDSNIGRLLDALDRSGKKDQTLVVFFSDNGAMRNNPKLKYGDRYNCGLRGKKGTIYNGGIVSPMFVRYPRELKAGTVVEAPVCVMDLFPTLADYSGGSLPADRVLDGVNIRSLLQGQADSIGERTICMQQDRRPAVEGDKPRRWNNGCIWQGNWKLVDGKELYRMDTDREEKNDLSAEFPERVAALRKAYSLWFDEVSSERGFGPLPYEVSSEKLVLENGAHPPGGWRMFAPEDVTCKISLREGEPYRKPDGLCRMYMDGKLIFEQAVDAAKGIDIPPVVFKKGDHRFDVFIEVVPSVSKVGYGLVNPGFIYLDIEPLKK
ncbi:MAG: sulfatase-like hydrolase/transferase [Kiritimatiellaceae bacterium]|nr:sulfatase-like hydrolase/transferase [Kiritimatiellaceae bacterium]